MRKNRKKAQTAHRNVSENISNHQSQAGIFITGIQALSKLNCQKSVLEFLSCEGVSSHCRLPLSTLALPLLGHCLLVQADFITAWPTCPSDLPPFESHKRLCYHQSLFRGPGVFCYFVTFVKVCKVVLQRLVDCCNVDLTSLTPSGQFPQKSWCSGSDYKLVDSPCLTSCAVHSRRQNLTPEVTL